MSKEIIEKIKEIVRKEADDWDWNYHIQIVVKYAKIMAKRMNADEEVVEIAAWLHDLTRLNGGDETHHLTGPVEAEKILKGFGYPQDKIDKVKHCIHAHRGSQSIKRETIEAECVASADAMCHFDTIVPLMYLNMVKLKRDIEETRTWMKAKIERSWKKLIPEAKEIMKKKYDAVKLILE